MTSSPYNGKRRIFFGLFNRKQKQITYALLNVFISLVFILLINTFSLFKFSQIQSLCSISGGTFDSATLSEYIGFMIKASLVAVIFVGIFVFMFVIVLTHRFFGPVVAINRQIQHLVDGEYSKRTSLRPNDELKDLAERLNHLAETLEKRHGDKKS